MFHNWVQEIFLEDPKARIKGEDRFRETICNLIMLTIYVFHDHIQKKKSKSLTSSHQWFRCGNFSVPFPDAHDMMTRESPKTEWRGIPMIFEAERRAQRAISSDFVFVLLPQPMEKWILWDLFKNKMKPAPPMFLAAAPSKNPKGNSIFGGSPIILYFLFLTGTGYEWNSVSIWWRTRYTAGVFPSKIHKFLCFHNDQNVKNGRYNFG